jgi:hypothetical protein
LCKVEYARKTLERDFCLVGHENLSLDSLRAGWELVTQGILGFTEVAHYIPLLVSLLSYDYSVHIDCILPGQSGSKVVKILGVLWLRVKLEVQVINLTRHTLSLKALIALHAEFSLTCGSGLDNPQR